LEDILAFVMLMALFVIATTPELVGEWQAMKDVAYDKWMIENAPVLGH